MECGNYTDFSSRRELLTRFGYGLGAAALHGLLGAPQASAAAFPNFAPRAKRVIFLFQAGGPSHLDLLDYKPAMKGRFNQDIPPSIFGGQRITGMVAQQDRFPVVHTIYGFKQYGESGMWLSELLPYTGKIVDQICLLRAMNTEAINHDPAITFRSDLRIQAVRRERDVVERTAAVYGQDRGPDLPVAGDEHGGDQSRSRDHVPIGSTDSSSTARAGCG